MSSVFNNIKINKSEFTGGHPNSLILDRSISVIYLYLKTHNKTGFKYLGKTISKDPYSYKGSGKLWKRHISKHGYDVKTEILLATNNESELKKAGLYYSSLWNVVESKEFANLIPESGDGGAMPWTTESREKLSKTNKGKKHTQESKNNYSNAQKKMSAEKSKQMKEYLQDPENYKKRCEQLASNWDNPEYREKISKKISSLKWCNDGKRNYRKKDIPNGFFTGRLK